MKVQCPGCKKVYHETTEKYDPDVRPNGAMVRLLDPWKGWQWAAFDAEGEAVSTTLCSEMLCPGCTAPLAPSGRLTVILTPKVGGLVDTINKNPGCNVVVTKDYIAVEEPAPLQEVTKLDDQADVTIESEPVKVPKKKRKAKKKKAKKKIK